MPDQYTLFDEPLSPDTLVDKLNEILEAAREKYGYYKMHSSGMFEMIDSASSGELYDILSLGISKDKSISFFFDGMLCIKFMVKKESVCTTKELYHEFLQGIPAEELKGSAAPKGGLSVSLPYADEIQFFSKSIEYLVKNKTPVHKFGCCSKYLKCSIEKRCVHENQFYSKGCYYRENLENGRVFYGENK